MKLQNRLVPFDKFVVRTPLKPLEDIFQSEGADGCKTLEQVRAWLQDPVAKEALFLASFELYESAQQRLVGALPSFREVPTGVSCTVALCHSNVLQDRSFRTLGELCCGHALRCYPNQ